MKCKDCEYFYIKEKRFAIFKKLKGGKYTCIITEVKTLQEVSREYDISFNTLKTCLFSKSFNLIEGVDFRFIGKGQSIICSPSGVKKITSRPKQP